MIELTDDMNKVIPKGPDMFGPYGPSMAIFNKNITGEDVRKICEDRRSHAKIAKSYGVSEELVKNLKLRGKT